MKKNKKKNKGKKQNNDFIQLATGIINLSIAFLNLVILIIKLLS